MRIVCISLVAVAVALTGAGCSREIVGTPIAAPGQTGLDTTELLATSCREYLEMDASGQRDVIKAIGKSGNKLVAMNPELWVQVAAGLCGFVDPSAPVKDVVLGQGAR